MGTPNTTLISRLSYRLATSSFTYDQCNQLAALLSPTLFNAYGIQRNCPRIVLYSTHAQAGLQVPHIFHIQGTEKLKLFLYHARANDNTGKLLQISTQLELGTTKHFLTLQHTKYASFVTTTWITNLWEYMSRCSATITPIATQYECPRYNDTFIMDVIYNAEIPHHHKIICNQVRIWLNILTLADIVIVNSPSEIIPTILAGKQGRASTWKWPRVQKCPTSYTDIWMKTMDEIIKPYIETHPLGNWNKSTHQTWTSFATSNGNYLQIGDDAYSRDDPTVPFTTINNHQHPHNVADVLLDDLNLLGISQSAIPPPPEAPLPLSKKFTRWKKTNLGRTNKDEHTIQRAADLLRQNKLVGASDGSIQ